MKKLIAGNWKMNNSLEQSKQLAKDVAAGLAQDKGLLDTCDFAVFPPFLHIGAVQAEVNADIAVGVQNCAVYENGAYTGETSAEMVADAGCTHVILGHSERREYFKETDAAIADKAVKAHKSGLITVICVGETEAQRDAGEQEEIVRMQLDGSLPGCVTAENTVIAYEPVWAIGTGKTATAQDIEDMHAFIRNYLQEKLADGAKYRILYGGSVKPGNAAEILATPNVDGALIGGASLKADDYLGIAKAA
jgi:triosephosphate isomerase